MAWASKGIGVGWPFLPCQQGSMPELVPFGAGEKPLSLPSKVEWVFSTALATTAIFTCSVVIELFWQGFKLFSGWSFSCSSLGSVSAVVWHFSCLFLAVCGRDVSPFQLPLIDSPGSWIANEDLCRLQPWAISRLCLQPFLYRDSQPISYFCVVPFPLSPVYCSSTQQSCTRSNGTLLGMAGNVPSSDTRVCALHRHTLVPFTQGKTCNWWCCCPNS